MTCVVGIDFDNTIVSYDALIHAAATERGLIPAGVATAKRTVRDAIRRRPDGEIDWQKLQALVYGPLMPQAQLIEGVPAFIRACQAAGIRVFIVSHKTEFAGYDESGTNLRAAALDWMRANRFFDRSGLGLATADVFFEATRDAKIGRIVSLACTHFIDDLEEVFVESSFPKGVEKLLFAPDPPRHPAPGVRVMTGWPAIHDYFFNRAA